MTADELEGLVAKATQGEWATRDHVVSEPHKLDRVKLSSQHGPLGSFDRHDAAIIIALVNNAPRLIEALRASEWQGMDSAPHDENILAAVKVRHKDGRAWWEMHTIVIDSETGEIAPDNDAGWGHDDYTHWMPLPAPPATEAGE